MDSRSNAHITPTFEADFDDRPPSQTDKQQDYAPPQLYEGNYDEWLVKAEAVLLATGHWKISLNETRPGSDEDAVRLLKRYIRREVLKRVSTEHMNDKYAFVSALQKVAKPFRLMDLPAELRTKIFAYALWRRFPIDLIGTTSAGMPTAVRRSPILQAPPLPLTMASRTIREETMPIYYQVNSFRMCLFRTELAVPDPAVVEVATWAKANRLWVKHMRKLIISCNPGEGIHKVHEATYTIKKGMKIESTFGGSEYEEPIRRRVNDCENACRLRGFEGEAIAMFFAKDVTMFD